MVPNCMLLQSGVASEILIFSGILSSLSPGNSDLPETLVWVMSSRTKLSDLWLATCTMTANVRGNGSIFLI